MKNTEQNHNATGRPKGRPRLDPERLVKCKDCGLSFHFSHLSARGLCRICGIRRQVESAARLATRPGNPYQEFMDSLDRFQKAKEAGSNK